MLAWDTIYISLGHEDFVITRALHSAVVNIHFFASSTGNVASVRKVFMRAKWLLIPVSVA